MSHVMRSSSPHAAPIDDQSARPGSLLHELVGGDGVPYSSFRATLRPRWGRVWLDLGLTWLALIAVCAAVFVLERKLALSWAFAVIPIAIVAVGLLVHRISSFLHEGAHFNLARTRHRSDLITNIAAGVLVLNDVRAYRPIHLAHHRLLGTTRDTERSYFNKPDVRYVLRTMAGLSAVEVLGRRSTSESVATGRRYLVVPVAGAIGHAALVAASIATGHLWLAIVWLFGIVSAYPVFNGVRQILEHRPETAQSGTDYRLVDEGALTRCFGHSLGGVLLGGVGFNRHLLHHWDPGLSYTCLPAAERYLRGTAVRPIVEARTTTYLATWRALLRAP
jgi:fatty acid desaturase